MSEFELNCLQAHNNYRRKHGAQPLALDRNVSKPYSLTLLFTEQRTLIQNLLTNCCLSCATLHKTGPTPSRLGIQCSTRLVVMEKTSTVLRCRRYLEVNQLSRGTAK